MIMQFTDKISQQIPDLQFIQRMRAFSGFVVFTGWYILRSWFRMPALGSKRASETTLSDIDKSVTWIYSERYQMQHPFN